MYVLLWRSGIILPDSPSVILLFEFISYWPANSYTIGDIEAYSVETYLYL